MDRERLRDLTREELEELTWQLVEVASLVEKVKQNSTNSSRPPSSDDPYRRRDHGRRTGTPSTAAKSTRTAARTAARRPRGNEYRGNQQDAVEMAGKRPGMPASGGASMMVVACEVDHDAISARHAMHARRRATLPARTARITSTISSEQLWHCRSMPPNIAISSAAARAA